MARCAALLIVGLAAILPPRLSGQEPVARARTLSGELVRVDLSHGSITLKSAERQPREYEIGVGADTRITSQGRVLRLEDLRPGERVLAVFTEDGRARRRASVLKLGPSAYAAPAPHASPTPHP
jgi:hypothetical protein